MPRCTGTVTLPSVGELSATSDASAPNPAVTPALVITVSPSPVVNRTVNASRRRVLLVPQFVSEIAGSITAGTRYPPAASASDIARVIDWAPAHAAAPRR